jgi:hypothetical protein
MLSTEATVIEFNKDFEFDNGQVVQESYSGGKPFNGKYYLNKDTLLIQTLIEGKEHIKGQVIHPTNRIVLTVNNEGFLFNYSNEVSNGNLAQSLKEYTEDFYQSNDYGSIIYAIDWKDGTSESRKESVLISIIISYIDFINDVSIEKFNSPICDLTWAEMHQLRQSYRFAFWVQNAKDAVIEEIPEIELK